MPVFTANEIAGFARQAGIPDDRIPTMVAIAFAESGGNSDDRNPTIGYYSHLGQWSDKTADVGLWQINTGHARENPSWTESWLRNPHNNAVAMASLSGKGSNLSPWDASKPVWGPAVNVKSDGKGGINWGQDEPEIIKNARNGLGSLMKKYVKFGWGQQDIPGFDASDVPVIGPTLDAIDNTEKATIATAKLAVKGTEWVANPHNWLRVGFVILGAGTVLVGLAKLIGYSPTSLVSGAVSARTGGAVSLPKKEPKAKPDTPDYDTFVTV